MNWQLLPRSQFKRENRTLLICFMSVYPSQGRTDPHIHVVLSMAFDRTGYSIVHSKCNCRQNEQHAASWAPPSFTEVSYVQTTLQTCIKGCVQILVWVCVSTALPHRISTAMALSSRLGSPETDASFAMSFDDSNQGVGLSNPLLSQGRRVMLDLVNRLHSTGVQIDIDLPQIAVIGSQSAGKSSLIESISGITLPRAAGTCTRCPTECRLSRSADPWKCIVSLRFITDTKGQTLAQVQNEIFGDTITDKSQVEERIRRAQMAILNPSTSSKKYLTIDDDGNTDAELSFSTNCVSLQISGPDVADLSFCDLPGLIASVGRGGNTNDIALVENLVTSYIKRSSCVILLTVACETDFENQGAHRLAKIHDPEGKRTIGVLTKPDRIPQGEEANWLPFIRNEKEALENNWYCVKQPNSNDLKQGITWVEARTREDEFFSMTAPWSELDPIFQKYLRTSNLVDRLSSILSDLISKRLPQIQDELEKAILATQQSLNLLPKAPPQDPLNEISNLLHVFMTDFTRHVEGVPDKAGLLQLIRPEYQKFRTAIRTTAPNFRPFAKRSPSRSLPKISFLSHEEDPDHLDEENDDISPGDPIYVDEVFTWAQQARTRELPGSYPFIVQQTYITTVVNKWQTPAMVLCKGVHHLLVDHVKTLVAKHFAAFGTGGLEQRVRVLLQEHVKHCTERAEERIEWLLHLEDRPFTLNTHYLTDYKDKFYSYYKGARVDDGNRELMSMIRKFKRSGDKKSQSPVSEPTGIAKVLAGLVEMGIIGVKPDDLPKLLPPDEMEPALKVMADVRAYFQVAYKRFTDNIPLAIDYELVLGAQRGVLSMLNAGLGINEPDGHRIAKEMAQESPHIAGRREELKKKLDRLNIASKELLRIGLS